MINKHALYVIVNAFFVVSFLLFSGCAKPPTQEVENAKKAIAEAKKKEADMYVQDIFAQAENALKRAQDSIAGKNYNEAKSAAVEATSLAKQAISQIEMNKAKMSEETGQKIIEAQKLMEEIKALAAAAIKKKAMVNQEEIQSAIGKFELDMLSVKDQLQTEKVRQSHDQVVSLMEQLKSQKETLIAASEQRQSVKK